MTKREFEERLEENKHENKTFVCIGPGTGDQVDLLDELGLGGYELFELEGDAMTRSYDGGQDEESLYYVTEGKSKDILKRLKDDEERIRLLENITNYPYNYVSVGVGSIKNPLTKVLGIDQKDLAIKVGDTFMFGGQDGSNADHCHYVTLKTYMEVVERNQKKPN